MDTVRLGVIGAGGMANSHMDYYPKVQGLTLAAICDTDPEALDRNVKKHKVPGFARHEELLDSGLVDAVLIATPHYFHPTIAIDAFKRGLHVLSEKPIGVHTKGARAAIEAHRQYPKLIYAAMFNQRTSPAFRKVKELLTDGTVGELRRATWIISTWFRTQSYYNSGGWRATWNGEGGGVIINQCPHNLDLITWFCGLPKRVTAQTFLGKYHRIEVEDEVNAIFEYPNGATGHFYTTTGEAPGTNRLEIVGDRATIVVESDTEVKLIRNTVAAGDFCKNSPERFATPTVERWTIQLPAMNKGQHQLVTENFVAAILRGERLIAPAAEGLNGLMLGNAMVLSGLKQKPVDLPLNDDEFYQLLQDLIAKSTFQKDAVQKVADDLGSSFKR